MNISNQSNLSIIVPVYNEEDSISSTIELFNSLLINFHDKIEVIFINDGSIDKTATIFENLLKNSDKRIKLITHDRNYGYGASIKTGIKESKYNNFFITDADDTYPNQDIAEFYNMFRKSNFDMIIGDRSETFNKNFFTRLLPKNIGREIVRIFSSILTNYKIKDINSGYRIFTKKLYNNCLDFLPDGFSLTSSITCLAINYNYKIKYEKIYYNKRKGKSKIKPVKDFLNFINLIIRMIIFTKPLRIFLPIFAFFFLIGIFLMLFRIFLTDQFFGTSVTLIILSFLFIFFGYVFELLLLIYKKNNE